MAKKEPIHPAQLVDFTADSYLDRTSRPIYALVYLLWFLVIYEVGTILISPDLMTQSLHSQQIRVVSFIWLQNFVEFLGFPPRFTPMATPLLVVVILLSLQITSKRPWKVYFPDFIPMTIECIFMSMPLIALSWMIIRSSASSYDQSAVSHAIQSITSCSAEIAAPVESSGMHQFFVNIVSGIGAGIYEELIFRLVLISLFMFLLQDLLRFPKAHAIVISVLLSAALFSAHHHFFPLNGTIEAGEAFTPDKFIFRTIAGIYFAVIFALRGFGVAAGTHAFYDIIAALLNAMFIK